MAAAAAAAAGPPTAEPLARGRRLHQSVPPERWCVTRGDLEQLVHDVRSALAAGGIPEDPLHPSAGHGDPNVGPSIYSVVEHFIKPVTLAAGGMSYALMRNPEGLQCHVFVTHAWAEGVFELAFQVLRSWPRGLSHLWCCALALPQNLDISGLLQVPLLQTPFARALHEASLVMVVPNQFASIYSRLWCVFEAYLATHANKDMVVPDAPNPSKQCKALGAFVLLPAVFGWGLGAVLQHLMFAGGFTRGEGFQVDILARALFSANTIKLVVVSLGIGNSFSMHRPACLCCSVAPITVLFSVMDAFCVRLVVEGIINFSPFGWCFVVLVSFIRIMLPVWETVRWLQNEQLSSQTRKLGENFSGVRHAQCSDEGDERRIREYIAGSEHDVDNAIQLLVRAGAYSSALRMADSIGIHVRHWGHSHTHSLQLGGLLLWMLVIFTCSNVMWLETSKTGWTDAPPLPLEVTVSLVGSATILLPLLARVCKWDRSRLLFASRLWFFSATCALVGVTLGVGSPHMVAKAHRDIYIRRPSGRRYIAVVVLWPGVCALISMIVALVGHARLLRCLHAQCRGMEATTSGASMLWASDLSVSDASEISNDSSTLDSDLESVETSANSGG